MTIEFTDEEIEIIKEIICDWGCDCPDTDYNKVLELEYKLGLRERPTPEQIAEQERKYKEFAESLNGKLMAEILKSNNHLLNNIDMNAKVDVLYGSLDMSISSKLKIRLPNDYIINKIKE
jgi:hypothetical protein